MEKSFLLTCLNLLLITSISNETSRGFKKEINKKAPIVSSSTISIHAPVEQVWKKLVAIDNWPTWQEDIKEAKTSGEFQAGTSFKWKSHGFKINSTLHTVETNKLIGWSGKSLGIIAIHNFTIQEKGGKTIIIIEESMEGLLAKLFRKSFQKKLELGLQNWGMYLKEACE